MELTLKRHEKSPYPTCGFFIEGDDLTTWIATLDRLELDPTTLKLYGLPSRRANVTWGCLVMTAEELSTDRLGPLASACRLANGRLVVPANAVVVPELTDDDLERLFRDDAYVLHPEFGLFKLTEPLDLRENFSSGEVPTENSLRPADHSVPSGKILSFSVAATPREDIELALDAGIERSKLDNTPLSLMEKLRLKLYKSVITSDGKGAAPDPESDKFKRLADQLGLSGSDAYNKVMEDFENLLERNKKEVDKLLGLMQTDPEAALRYAIPLDEHGYSRGRSKSAFTMQDRGLDFSIFGGLGGGTGGSVSLGNEFFRIQKQYQATARQLEESGKHEKAAYVYLKLLKDHAAGAATLRKGKHFEKAAVIYLRYLKNESLAAECYEEGKIYDEAIPLYVKLKRWEKVGDLHVLRGDDEAARSAYLKQVDKYLVENVFIKAARLSKEKMHDLSRAQQILLRGWDENIDAFNCLQFYLANIADGETAWREIERIGRQGLNDKNDTVFLRVLSKEYAKKDEHREEVRNLAYGLLSELLSAGRVSAHEVLAFNEKNDRLRADALRYETQTKGR